ncbi:hypothetical protein Ancab_039575 [Ancistrocladus abbreviatus]
MVILAASLLVSPFQSATMLQRQQLVLTLAQSSKGKTSQSSILTEKMKFSGTDHMKQIHHLTIRRLSIPKLLWSDAEMELQRKNPQRKRKREDPSPENHQPSPPKRPKTSSVETELHIAAREGDVGKIIQILQRNLELIAEADWKGDLPLHEAASAGQLEAVETLTLFMMRYVEPKLSIGKANKEGNTALHLAVQKGDEKVARYLIEKEPDTSYSLNKKGISPLYLAIEARLRDVVQSILDYTSSRKPKSIMHAAIRARDRVILARMLENLRPLVNSFDEEGRTPLSYAAYIGYLDGVDCILAKFPNSAFSCDEDGSYPIHKASNKGNVEIVKRFLLLSPKTVDLLNGHGQNILHVAAMSGNTKTVSYLLKMQVIKKLICSRDKDGKTALHLATMNDHLDVISCLEDAVKCEPSL